MSEDGFINVPGRLPAELSREEASERIAAAAEAAPKPTSFDPSKLPLVKFPIRIRLRGEVVANHNGELAGITFKDGVSVKWLDHEHVNHFAAAMFPVIDVATGIVISPLSEGTTYRVEGKLWNQFQPLPEHCLENVGNQEPSNGLQTEKGQGRQEVLIPSGDVSAADLSASISASFRKLRPGHKDDFDADGKPLIGRVSAIVGKNVPQKLCNESWALFDSRLDADKSAFAMPAGNGVEDVLESIIRTKGARYLRQYAETKGIQNAGRSGSEIIEALVKGGITMIEARSLL